MCIQMDVNQALSALFAHMTVVWAIFSSVWSIFTEVNLF